MIFFFTAGMQLPFTRMGNILTYCALHMVHDEFIYQSGPGGTAQIDGQGMDNLLVRDFFSPDDYQENYEKADLIITHAGMGNMISFIEKGLPFIMIPRRAQYSEHRNDHQIDSAESISKMFDVPYFSQQDEVYEFLSGFKKGSFSISYDASSIIQKRKSFFANIVEKMKAPG
ncbi:glycosyltransferase [Kushneria phosphatilytica]|uniref:Uncharacterized protein n=1 Tax=Kushneria phosphatilytica TaxID=657387 RepID=A0A1S1NUE2_9GAMM|nr:glycosyltransferase [Kushneria phosphatilytica]OHV09514.1 hypothetical protein BH688_10970 [Kushneria phosphatilytica]QEL11796.1 hypothetical protein FY550_12040 [Kushneria phosphatilytica]